MSRERRAPAHGTVVAYVALFAAVATGGAYAAAQIGSDDIKDDAVRTNHIKGKQVKGSDVAQGAGLEAIAYVSNNDGTFSEDIPERGFDSVEDGGTGVYCLTPSGSLDPATDAPIVTFEYNDSAGDNFAAMWDRTSNGCDGGEYEIQTYDADTGSATDGGAFVVMVP